MFDMNYLLAIKELAVLFVCVALLLMLSWIKNRYRKKIMEQPAVGTAILAAIGGGRIIVVLSSICVALSVAGVNVSAMLTGFGLVSALVGLALQDTLKDVIMGFHIVADHFFSVGEMVEYKGNYYTVVGFTLSTTKLGSDDDHSIFSISNREISSIRRLAKRLEVNVPTPYSVPETRIVPILKECCEEIKKLPEVTDCQLMGLNGFAPDAAYYRIRIFDSLTNNRGPRRQALMIIRQIFEREYIYFPFEYQHVALHEEA